MPRLVGRLIFVLLLGIPGSVSAAIAQGADCGGSDDSSSNLPRALVQGSPRLRGSDPVIAAAIDQAVEQSPTFRQLVSTINCTDGIVYVHYGTCRRDVLACLPLAVTQAGANRILHIRVDRRRKGHDLMVVIGHELRHAIELLSDPTVIDDNTAYNFYQRLTPIAGYSFETEAAIQTALNVNKELRKWAKQHQVVKPIRESAASFTQDAHCAESSDSASNLAQACVQGSPRLRGSDRMITTAIEQAHEQSPTFRQLVAAITRTDGIVYVHYGACGRNVLACLLLAVTRAGPNRILHIRVDRRRKGHDLMVAIGHELSHAVELLNVPTVIDATTAQNYYRRNAAIEYAFETEEAIEIELKIDKELRQWAKQR